MLQERSVDPNDAQGADGREILFANLVQVVSALNISVLMSSMVNLSSSKSESGARSSFQPGTRRLRARL